MSRLPKRKLILSLALALAAAGCNYPEPKAEQARLYENGSPKPIVAIVPVIDGSRSKAAWNLGEEFTATIHYRLMQRDRLYLVDQEKVAGMMKRIKENQNPFDSDLLWIKKAFFEDEFVVFMELISHEELELPVKDSGKQLSMKMRVRVIDLREEEPKIALQEIIEDAHNIPLQFNAISPQTQWGKENYSISPVGIAHAQLSKEVAARLEEYIMLSMSRKHE